jgi:magnesium-transporting ATPase (P-type)
MTQAFLHSGCAGSDGASSSRGDEAAADATLVLEGKQFRDFVVGPNGIIDKTAFTAIWPRLRVLARCSPQDKYTIVSGQYKHSCPLYTQVICI